MGTQALTVLVSGQHEQADQLRQAVEAGGAQVGADGATAMVWLSGPASALSDALDDAPDLQWLQLPSAGIESYLDVLREHPDLTVTCAKNIYGDSVAEHAFSMLLALRRGVITHARQQRWDDSVSGPPLVGSGDVVTVLGGGGIAARFATLIAPFGVNVRVVRRQPDADFPAPYAEMFSNADLSAALTGAAAVVITLPLTEETTGLVAAAELDLLAPGAIVINVGRGGILDSDALLKAVRAGQVGAAGLDVTDPEPLPAEHPLWDEPGVLITSHTSNPSAWRSSALARMITANVSAYAEGAPLAGLVSLTDGY